LILAFHGALAQNMNIEILTDEGNPQLVGHINEEGLQSKNYSDWYTPNKTDYKVDSETLEQLSEALKKHHILVFMGTWCSDSRREVPHFIKILETVDFPMEKLKIVGLDYREAHYKTSPTGEEWGLSIKRVPTFIFLKDGKEVNRIVESPIESLEKDMLKILDGQPYTPNYHELMKSE
jgi:thiol-disulfide isomerase/thioredoxin